MLAQVRQRCEARAQAQLDIGFSNQKRCHRHHRGRSRQPPAARRRRSPRLSARRPRRADRESQRPARRHRPPEDDRQHPAGSPARHDRGVAAPAHRTSRRACSGSRSHTARRCTAPRRLRRRSRRRARSRTRRWERRCRPTPTPRHGGGAEPPAARRRHGAQQRRAGWRAILGARRQGYVHAADRRVGAGRHEEPRAARRSSRPRRTSIRC